MVSRTTYVIWETLTFLQSVCSRSRTLILIGVSNILAPIVVNHLMVTVVKTAITLKCFIDMEKRNISISLEQAREWYHNDCGILRRLALQAFTEEEINEPTTLNEVLSKMRIRSLTLEMLHNNRYHAKSLEKIKDETMVDTKLRIVAEYLNRGWEPGVKERKFFIAQGKSYSPSAVDLENGFYVNFHETVKYPGVVYFRTQEDAIKAFNMLKDEINALYGD